MSLLHASDDALRLILFYLPGQSVAKLWMTGDRRLISRLQQNTEHLLCEFDRPTLFPVSCFNYRALKSLTVRCTNTGDGYGHIALTDFSMFPLEPMKSLEKLDLTFPLSRLFIEAPPSPSSLSLASSFPRLTSLSIQSSASDPFSDGWAERLPRTLLSLKMDLYHPEIPSSSFHSLPSGLKELEIGQIGAGDLNLGRFEQLRRVSLGVADWHYSSTLPESIEELVIQVRSSLEHNAAPNVVFPISKLPPRLRVWNFGGPGLTLDFDCKAPSTLEDVTLSEEHYDLSPEELLKFFHTENLRALYMPGLSDMPPSLWDALPNLEFISQYESINESPMVLEKLPRKLKSLWLQNLTDARTESLNDLPPMLEEILMTISDPSEIAQLPRKLKTLDIFPQAKCTPYIPASAMRELPPSLTKLHLSIELIESEECLQVLPASLNHLEMVFTSTHHTAHVQPLVERFTFPKSLQESLQSISMYFFAAKGKSANTALETLIPKFSPFSCLTMLHIAAHILIKSDTLSNLPQTLTGILLHRVEFENFGLPLGQRRSSKSDWKNGALSRLPEGLIQLHLITSSDKTDIMVISKLPARLASLRVNTPVIFDFSPKQLFDALPRRLSHLECIYRYIEIDRPSTNAEDLETDDDDNGAAHEREMKEARDEYYADPFWKGIEKVHCGEV